MALGINFPHIKIPSNESFTTLDELKNSYRIRDDGMKRNWLAITFDNVNSLKEWTKSQFRTSFYHIWSAADRFRTQRPHLHLFLARILLSLCFALRLNETIYIAASSKPTRELAITLMAFSCNPATTKILKIFLTQPIRPLWNEISDHGGNINAVFLNGINWGHPNLHSFIFNNLKFCNFMFIFKADILGIDMNTKVAMWKILPISKTANSYVLRTHVPSIPAF